MCSSHLRPIKCLIPPNCCELILFTAIHFDFLGLFPPRDALNHEVPTKFSRMFKKMLRTVEGVNTFKGAPKSPNTIYH